MFQSGDVKESLLSLALSSDAQQQQCFIALIEAAMGKSADLIRGRLKLLKLPKDLQEKVHLGKIGVERALKHLDGKDSKDDPKEKSKRKAPSLKEIKSWYSAPSDQLPDDLGPLVTEEVRQIFAFWLGVKYEPLQAHQDQVA